MGGIDKLTKTRPSLQRASASPAVQKLWMNRRKLVDGATRKKKSGAVPFRSRRPNMAPGRFRAGLRLIGVTKALQSQLLNVTVHRYEEQIGGRTYFIEVSPVSASRWRAQIARLPGMPTSLMPFYGRTPDEAARELSKWLSLVSAPVGANT
jgi:hypothetical protein